MHNKSMRNKSRRVIVILTAVLMLILMPAAASYAESPSIVHKGKSGDISWSINSNGLLLIEGEGNFKKSNSGEFYTDKYGGENFSPRLVLGWKKYADEITSARVKVKGCDSLKGLLSDLKNLKTVDFTGSDTSEVRDFSYLCMGYVYIDSDNYIRYKSSLESVDLTDLDTSSAIDMHDMFADCEKLKEIDVSGWNTSNVTDMTGLFDCCHKLEVIKGIENFDVRNVTSMVVMFQQDYVLKRLDLGNWLTVNLESMFSAFSECYALTGSLKILSKDFNCDGVFKFGTFSESTGFTLYYVNGPSSRSMVQKMADTAEGYEDRITIKEITEPSGHKAVKDKAVKPTCISKGLTEGSHCSVCGKVITRQKILPFGEHTYGSWKVVDKPTTEAEGYKERTCTLCGEVDGASIAKLKKSISKADISVSDKRYTGKRLKPAVEVTCNGVILDPNKDYTVTYANNRNPGKAKVVVHGMGDYKGTASVTFRISLNTSSFNSLDAGRKSIAATWKKAKNITGYQIQVATDKKFTKGKKSVLIKKKTTVSKKITKLKAKKKYYVRIRTYKTIKGKKYYSKWSKAKTVRTR